MAVDTGQPGLAQRYYIQALRLAQASGDRGYGGYVLAASMSHLAAQLGNPREIAQLARAAQEGARGQVPPRAQAMFYAAEARGHALMGDLRQCQEVAGRALAALEQAEDGSGDDPEWIAHFDHAYLADELAHCYRDLEIAAGRRGPACRGLDRRPSESRARRLAIGMVLLATAQVQQREVEEACRTGTRAIELMGTLRSSRGAEYLDDLQQRLEPYGSEPSVREFTARLEIQAA